MITQAALDSWLGKSMSDICPNGYDSTSLNHCAHFVAHAANMSFGYTCKMQAGGTGEAANLRVHEVFAQCATKQEIPKTGPGLSGIIFISSQGSFVTKGGTTKLSNVPKKHIGFILNSMVWHYSNSQNKVIKQTTTAFRRHYSGQTNALWFGSMPASGRLDSAS